MASHICYPVIPSTKSCTTTHLLAQQPLLGLSGSFRMHQGLHGAIHLQRLIFLATEHLVGRDFLLETLCDLCVICGRSRILPDCAVNTSSAAQGGGGSFKNRRPIGEVGCCVTDGRANPLLDRKVVGAMFFGVAAMVAVVTLPQLLDVVWCN